MGAETRWQTGMWSGRKPMAAQALTTPMLFNRPRTAAILSQDLQTLSAAGSTDAWVLKLGGNGTVDWEKTYGGENGDEICAIQQTADGGYIAAGYTSSYGAGIVRGF